jgi:hypothetical protein
MTTNSFRHAGDANGGRKEMMPSGHLLIPASFPRIYILKSSILALGKMIKLIHQVN